MEKTLNLFSGYYNILEDDIPEPFDAHAFFKSKDMQYFLIKAAKISEYDASEHAFFKVLDSLDEAGLQEIVDRAWVIGLKDVKPYYGHRCSDVTLIVIADQMDEATRKLVQKLNYYIGYKWSFWGSSSLRLVAWELSTGKIAYNRHGDQLKKLFSNIL